MGYPQKETGWASRRLSVRRASSGAVIPRAGLGGDAAAQVASPTALPTIEVTASPIQTRREADTAGAGTLTDLLDQSFSAVTTMTAEQIERQNGGALGNGGSLGNLLFDKP